MYPPTESKRQSTSIYFIPQGLFIHIIIVSMAFPPPQIEGLGDHLVSLHLTRKSRSKRLKLALLSWVPPTPSVYHPQRPSEEAAWWYQSSCQALWHRATKGKHELPMISFFFFVCCLFLFKFHYVAQVGHKLGWMLLSQYPKSWILYPLTSCVLYHKSTIESLNIPHPWAPLSRAKISPSDILRTRVLWVFNPAVLNLALWGADCRHLFSFLQFYF